MRSKSTAYLLVAVAAILWGALVLFVNENSPTSVNQSIFLAIWLSAVTSSVIPISYVANSRWARPLGRRGDLTRALRQGILMGVLATILMALRFMRVLTLIYGVVLVLLVVMMEMLIHLRTQ